jgi:hypothetical protein
MTQQTERRNNAEDELPPDILALLESCGGEIRESDRLALARQRAAARGALRRRRSDLEEEQAGAAFSPAEPPGAGA